MAKECGCGDGKLVLITACSGAANTGLLADQVARGLRSAKAGSLTCLAALGADLSGYVESARRADRNVVIDGCPIGCGAKIYAKLGIACEQFVMTDFGAEKGKTEITAELITSVTGLVAAKL